jgi:hypothetical protein
MSPLLAGLTGILIFFVLLALRMPIAYAMALVGFAGFAFLTSPSAAFTMVSKEIYATFSSLDLIRSIIARPQEYPTRAAIACAVCESLTWKCKKREKMKKILE